MAGGGTGTGENQATCNLVCPAQHQKSAVDASKYRRWTASRYEDVATGFISVHEQWTLLIFGLRKRLVNYAATRHEPLKSDA
jgi:hypothetical protein